MITYMLSENKPKEFIFLLYSKMYKLYDHNSGCIAMTSILEKYQFPENGSQSKTQKIETKTLDLYLKSVIVGWMLFKKPKQMLGQNAIIHTPYLERRKDDANNDIQWNTNTEMKKNMG